MQQKIVQFKKEAAAELTAILNYWMQYTIDVEQGGFYGRLDNNNNVDKNAPKGSVLNSRILWTFSAAYNSTKNAGYLKMAERAYQYIRDCFIDEKYGGVYWTVTAAGKPLDTKKQIYALSFAVYGLSEFYRSSKNEEAKTEAIKLYEAIVKHSYDARWGGYIEALSREWNGLQDLRLSVKDANERKSMNTHLHLLEGFANLYLIWPDAGLKEHIIKLIHVFLKHIINPDTHHLYLFFDDDWTPKSNIVSYGHDIEAAWLLQEAATIINEQALIEKVKAASLAMATATLKGLDKDGGLWYEYDPATNHEIKEKHSWPQAEAVVGFYNAYQISGDVFWLEKSLGSWEFIKKYIVNREAGEWYWGIEEGYSVMAGQDKVGLWKCPYHSTRACLQIMNRTSESKK